MNTNNRSRAFISHASEDLSTAKKAEAVLDAAGFDSWLDQSDIRIGALLGNELLQAIEESHFIVLMWSKAAASRWVATEILTAFHSNRFIVPCVLDKTELPQFLSRSIYLDLSKNMDAIERLGEQAKRVSRTRNEFPAISSYHSQELKDTIQRIYSEQMAMLDELEKENLSTAQKLQAELDPTMRATEERWRYDPTILNLAGYHRKNAYMLNHWEEYCAGRFPKDPLLEEGERRFFDTLFVNPIDMSALNGLGNILLFEGELAAAEFFVKKAIECAANAGMPYTNAEHDLKVIQSRTRAPELGRAF